MHDMDYSAEYFRKLADDYVYPSLHKILFQITAAAKVGLYSTEVIWEFDEKDWDELEKRLIDKGFGLAINGYAKTAYISWK